MLGGSDPLGNVQDPEARDKRQEGKGVSRGKGRPAGIKKKE